MVVRSRTLELMSTDTSEPDGFPRQYFGVRGERARVIVKRMGGAATDPLPERLEEWLDALGLAHGCEVTVMGDGGEGAVYWSVRIDGEGHTFRAPFDDEAIDSARHLRSRHPPRGYAAVKDGTDLSVGQQVTVRPTGRNQILAGVEGQVPFFV